MSTLVVIPARMASVRFPGKPLVLLNGRPMIEWVYRAAVESEVGPVVIATPDAEIAQAAQGFGAAVEMTRADHPSGTDRLAEIADRTEFQGYINVQGDEPLIEPATIRACAQTLDSGADVGSLFAVCDPADIENPAVVKVVLTATLRALYFSRALIPYPRNAPTRPTYRHVGIYAFRREALQAFATLPPSPLEQTEGLEQLRFLEHGFTIQMAPSPEIAFGVDTPDQATIADRMLRARIAE
ncbi:MAG: 3-deoxy-manno-octulosonate cytidylyltransferase [Fimbriimonadaceae bacterium]|nr:3-deoxy-manno-octulosonate cytidylyltransferase [Fimbriimonadaceae bacterium]